MGLTYVIFMVCSSGMLSSGMLSKRKTFFFEKKKQKTFGPLRACAAPVLPHC
jgi:cellobiose-specific phosphotransferase system component IIB